jgi:hypothetical protein
VAQRLLAQWRWASLLCPLLCSGLCALYDRARVWAVGIRCVRRDATELAFNGHGGVWLRLQLAARPSVAMAADWQQRRPDAASEQVAAPSHAGKPRPGRALGQSRAACARDRWSNNYTASPWRRRAVSNVPESLASPRAASRAAAGVRSCPWHAAPHARVRS